MRPSATLFFALFASVASLPAGEQVSEQVVPPQSAVPVKVAALPLTRDQLLAELTGLLSAQLKLDGELQLELNREWNGPSLPAGSSWRIELVEVPTLPSANMMLRCRILIDNASAGEWSLLVRAQLWRDAWVTRLPVDRGQTFDSSHVDARRVDTFRERDTMPTTAGDSNLAYIRPIAAGRLLTWRDLAKKSLVRKGEIVEVSAIDGQLSISMKAQAQANGSRGDTVIVRNLESRRDFPALVVAENRVQVRF